MPFADYADHADCVAKNRHKDDPDAYCAEVERRTAGKKCFFAVDFNALGWEGDGVIFAAVDDQTILDGAFLGDTVVLGDDEGNLCDGLVIGLRVGGVLVAADMTTWRDA